MTVERNNANTIRLKERHIGDLRQMVCVDKQLELRFELEAVLTQIASRQRVISGHLLGERGVNHHGLLRLRHIDHPGAVESGNILGRTGAVSERLLTQHIRLGGSSVLAEDT